MTDSPNYYRPSSAPKEFGFVPESKTAGTSSSNLSSAVYSLLATFGVRNASVQDQVTELVKAHLDERSLDVHVVGLRYGELTLAADVVVAALLRYETDNLRTLVNEKFPNTIERVVVRIRR